MAAFLFHSTLWFRFLAVKRTNARPVGTGIRGIISTSVLQFAAPPFKPSGMTLTEELSANTAAAHHASEKKMVAALRGIATKELPVIDSFGRALGALYVLEGSTLGGRIIAGIIAAASATFLTFKNWLDKHQRQPQLQRLHQKDRFEGILPETYQRLNGN
jgi:hypothetical protein